MKFFGTYGCNAGGEYSVALEANCSSKALNWCYESAVEERESYEGLHGIRSFEQIAEDMGYIGEEMSPDEILDVGELYQEEIEEDIFYNIVPFDESNEEHLRVLYDQEKEFWKVQKGG